MQPISVNRTMFRLTGIVNAVVMTMGAMVWESPHFSFVQGERKIEPASDEPPFYTWTTDTYFIRAQVRARPKDAKSGNPRKVQLMIQAVRIKGDHLAGAPLWHIDAWWQGLHHQDKPEKGAWGCWENSWELGDRKLQNQPNFPPPELSFKSNEE